MLHDSSILPTFLQSRQLSLSHQRDLLKSVHHLEAILVFGRKHCIARPVDHKGLHPSSKGSLDLLDVVAKEKDSSGLKLEQKSKNGQHHIERLFS